jgi:hypothetical protein
MEGSIKAMASPLVTKRSRNLFTWLGIYSWLINPLPKGKMPYKATGQCHRISSKEDQEILEWSPLIVSKNNEKNSFVEDRTNGLRPSYMTYYLTPCHHEDDLLSFLLWSESWRKIQGWAVFQCKKLKFISL